MTQQNRIVILNIEPDINISISMNYRIEILF